MTTETTKKEGSETKQDPKVQSMLKALGYLDDVKIQAQLPAEREEKPEPDAKPEAKPDDATKAEGGDGAEKPAEGDDAEKPEGGAADEKPEGEAKPDAVAEEKKEEKRVRKVTKSEVTQAEKKSPSLEEIVSAVKGVVNEATKPVVIPKEEEKKDDTFRKNLHPAELKALEVAEYAEKAMPEKYKDAATKEVEWIRRHREFVNNFVKENGKFDATNPEYQQFIRENRPIIPQHDREELLMKQAEDRASKKAREDMSKEMASRDRAIAELRFAPIINQVGESVKNDVLSAAGDELAKAFKDNPTKLAEDFPVEAPVVAAVIGEAVEKTTEYLQLAKGIKQFDAKNPTHNWIVQFVETQGKQVDANVAEGKPLIRDGKVLVSRERYYTMLDKGQDVSTFDTFTDQDIIKMVSYSAKTVMENRVKAERQRFETASQAAAKRAAVKNSAAGGDKKEEKPSVKPDAKPEDKKPNPPKGGATASPGAKTGGANTKVTPAFLKALGYPGDVPKRE